MYIHNLKLNIYEGKYKGQMNYNVNWLELNKFYEYVGIFKFI